MRWRPIKTAPKDGTIILLAEYQPGNDVWEVREGRWVDAYLQYPVGLDHDRVGWSTMNYATHGWLVGHISIMLGGMYDKTTYHARTIHFNPTHWMPMPKPPVKRPR